MFGLKRLARAQERWNARRRPAATGMRVVLGDRKAGALIAAGWTIERTETALISGTSSGVLLYHMKAPSTTSA
jgi:hypothetical protein